MKGRNAFSINGLFAVVSKIPGRTDRVTVKDRARSGRIQ